MSFARNENRVSNNNNIKNEERRKNNTIEYGNGSSE